MATSISNQTSNNEDSATEPFQLSEKQKTLMQQLIDEYDAGVSFGGYSEEYKWELLDKTAGKDILEVICYVKDTNLIATQYVKPVLEKLLAAQSDELRQCCTHLVDESKPLDMRLADFKSEMKFICRENKEKVLPNDERTASAILMCVYPDKYTIYQDKYYQYICNYLGVKSRKPGQKYKHFMEIIDSCVSEFGADIQQRMLPEINKYPIKPLNLAIQTLFYCIFTKMEKEKNKHKRKYWLVGYTLGNDGSQVDKFIKDGLWFALFDDSKSDQQQLKLTQELSKDDVIILKSTSTKGVKHDQPFMRIKGVGVVLDNVKSSKDGEYTKCECRVKYFNIKEKDFEGSKYGSYRKIIHKAEPKIQDVIDYIKTFITNDMMTTDKYKEYIDLLKANKNLVLTGAPGTGKTYLAHRIAEAMGAETRFVQFHPSYDYTDFVEGLRPVDTDGTIGFERKDGAFKAFCKEAIRNIQDSEKSIDQLSEERSWQERLSDFVDEAIEKKKKFKTVNGSEFVITDQREHSLPVYNEQNEKTSELNVNTNEVLTLLINNVPLNVVRDIRRYFKRKGARQADSYAYAIIKAIRAEKRQVAVEKVSKVERKNFVFIIDEINRGEASKIFGELFYAIDPGYRVVAGDEDDVKSKRVDTQYQNLVPESDVFSKGFYVPDNVYILATMNDIDRSVESMDFAMRRRFTWKEVRPEDTATMFDGLDCAEDAKETMTRLNEVIAKTEELGAAYMIGPAYFLKLEGYNGDFERLWQLNIEPLLKEYLRGFRKADELLEKFRRAYFNEAEGTGNEA